MTVLPSSRTNDGRINDGRTNDSVPYALIAVRCASWLFVQPLPSHLGVAYHANLQELLRQGVHADRACQETSRRGNLCQGRKNPLLINFSHIFCFSNLHK